MKTINLFLASAVLGLMVQTTFAQTTDTAKNKVEIKKKTKIGVNGRQVAKIKMESKGTPEAVTGAVEGAIPGSTPKKVVTQVQPASPTVVVVQPEPAVKATATTTAAVSKPVTTTRTTTTTTNYRHVSTSKPVTRKVTTTTTLKKQ